MAKLKKEKVFVSIESAQDVPEDVKAGDVIPFKEPESYLVRWNGGEEVFATKAQAVFAANTHTGGYIVV